MDDDAAVAALQALVRGAALLAAIALMLAPKIAFTEREESVT